MLNKITNEVRKSFAQIKDNVSMAVDALTARTHVALAGTKAEAYVDTGVKILIAVVIGALLLAGLYTLFGDTIMPTVTERVEDLFDYAG